MIKKLLFALCALASVCSAQPALVPNNTITGTQQYMLAKATTVGGQSTAIITATSDTAGILGPVQTGAGTSGNAIIATSGNAFLTFDGATVAGDYVVNSPTVVGEGHDAGATCPTSSQIVGRIFSTNTVGGVYTYFVGQAGCGFGGGGGGGMVYPGVGLALSSGTAWLGSLTVGSGNNNIPQLNGTNAQLLPSEIPPNINITGTAANITSPVTLPSGTTIQGYLALTGGSLSGKLNIATSVSGSAGLNCGTGAAPASPVNGDVWCTASGLFAQINGVTQGPFGAGSVPQATPGLGLVSQGPTTPSTYQFGVNYITPSENWAQTIAQGAQNLTAGTLGAVTLPAGIVGIDVTSGAGYNVLINDANPESVAVTAGSYTYASGGTIQFTPFYSHGTSAQYIIGSDSSGIQEGVNYSCGTSSTTYLNALCKVVLPSNGPGYPTYLFNTWNVYGTIVLHATGMTFDGGGASLNCNTTSGYTLRGACLQVGDLKNANDFVNITVTGLSFRTPNTNLDTNPAFAGVNITNVARANTGVVTVTTGSAHGFRSGDMGLIMFPDNPSLRGDFFVATTPTATTFTYQDGCTSTCTTDAFSSVASPGVVALEHVAVLDNANNTHIIDAHNHPVGNFGLFNNFFDFWDDEGAVIDGFSNGAIGMHGAATWSASYFFAGGNSNLKNVVMAPVLSINTARITANGSNCVTDFASNGVYWDNSVCQASSLWAANISDG